MDAVELVTAVTHAVYLVIFARVALVLARHRTVAHLDMTLFFGATTISIVQTRLAGLFGPSPILAAAGGAAAMALPYLLLRLADDFEPVPRWAMRAAAVGYGGAAALIVLLQPLPAPATLSLVAYFVIVAGYATARFGSAAGRTVGVTRRRMEAIAAGTLFLVAILVVVGLELFLPMEQRGVGVGVRQVLALGSALAYFVGFAPPAFLRRAWQEPELRAFLARAAELPRLPTTAEIVRQIQEGAARTVGANAIVGLVGPDGALVPIAVPGGRSAPSGEYLGGRALTEGRTIFSTAPGRDDPAHAAEYAAVGAGALIATPIVAGPRRLGVLIAYAPRAPIFAETDIELVRLLADQAAVILESRALIDEAARVRAKEEAARLKEDFLSAAAHDLKTPLTTLVAQAQYLERKAKREPATPVDAASLERIVREAKRLNALVLELLDASRLEQGRLLGERLPVDLAAVVREVCERQPERSRIALDAGAPAVGRFDEQRLAQVVENLVENALKYSAPDGQVRVRVERRGDRAHLSVSDTGIGIPPEDLPHVFERFHRAGNVDSRRFAGMGLGLYIVRGIVEQHGGTVRVASEPGRGTTFDVVLPAAAGTTA